MALSIRIWLLRICLFGRESHLAYRRDKFGTIGKKESVKLSQVWNLNHRYRVGALRKHKYSILHEGRNNSVVALARGQYDEKELVSCFFFLQACQLLSTPGDVLVKT